MMESIMGQQDISTSLTSLNVPRIPASARMETAKIIQIALAVYGIDKKSWQLNRLTLV